MTEPLYQHGNFADLIGYRLTAWREGEAAPAQYPVQRPGVRRHAPDPIGPIMEHKQQTPDESLTGVSGDGPETPTPGKWQERI